MEVGEEGVGVDAITHPLLCQKVTPEEMVEMASLCYTLVNS
jgi:hypothetical protein